MYVEKSKWLNKAENRISEISDSDAALKEEKSGGVVRGK